MVVNGETIAEVRKYFNLNLYEAKIWLALLSRGVATAGELSDIANVPRSRAYDVLESLQRKGLVVMQLGKPLKYMAVSPQEAIENLKKRMEEEHKENLQKLEKLKESETMRVLETLYSKGAQYIDPSQISGTLRGRFNIYSKLNNLIKNAQNEVVLVTTPTELPKKLEALKEAIEEAKNRGVNVKIITSDAKGLSEKLGNIVELKDAPLGRLAIIDGKDVVLMTTEDNIHASYDTAIWLKSEFLGNTLKGIIEKLSKQ